MPACPASLRPCSNEYMDSAAPLSGGRLSALPGKYHAELRESLDVYKPERAHIVPKHFSHDISECEHTRPASNLALPSSIRVPIHD